MSVYTSSYDNPECVCSVYRDSKTLGDVTGRLSYVGLQFAPFSLKWIKSVYFSESLN